MKKVPGFLKNKYILCMIAFLVWIMFFDRNDLISRYTYRQKLKKLEQARSYYLDEIARNRTDMNELMTNPKNLERFAREKYLMKKDSEDLFVFVRE